MKLRLSKLIVVVSCLLSSAACQNGHFQWPTGAIKTPPHQDAVWYSLTSACNVDVGATGTGPAYEAYTFSGKVCRNSSLDGDAAAQGAAGWYVPAWIESHTGNTAMCVAVSYEKTTASCDVDGQVQGALQATG